MNLHWVRWSLVLALTLAAAGARQTQAQQAPATLDDTVKVTATGSGSYRPEDVARSKEEALEAARRDAVEQVSGVIVTSESEMRNLDLVKDEVSSHSQGFIKRSRIVKEGRDGPLYQVTIEAEVGRGAFLKQMNDSLEELYKRVGKPRVMLVIQEKHTNEAGVSSAGDGLGIAEKEIRKLLLAQGFTFVDPRVETRAQMAELAAKGKAVGKDSLAKLGQITQAEIVIVGTARSSDKGALSRFQRAQADISLDALRTDNGQVLASEVGTAVGLHINAETAAVNAMQKAAQELTPKLMQQVTYQWIKERNEGGRVELIVKNAAFGDLLALRRALGNGVRGVKKVTQRSFSQGTALLELESKDPADRIAEAISETSFQGFTLEIVDVTPKSLIVTMKKKQP
jgi:hypothetical protein